MAESERPRIVNPNVHRCSKISSIQDRQPYPPERKSMGVRQISYVPRLTGCETHCGTTFRIPSPKSQIMGHDVSDQPFVQKAPKSLNALLSPGLPAPQKIGDLCAKFFVQFQVLVERRISASLHESLLVGKMRDDVIQQFVYRLLNNLQIEGLNQYEQMLMFVIDLRNIDLETFPPFDDERFSFDILLNSHFASSSNVVGRRQEKLDAHRNFGAAPSSAGYKE